MGFWEALDKFNDTVEKIKDLFDDSPVILQLSRDNILNQKIKAMLEKYAIYTELNSRDIGFNGFGLYEIEFIGKDKDVENFKLVIEKIIYDYLRSYYLDFTRTSSEIKNIGDSQFIVRVYYSYSKKTLNNLITYFSKISAYNKDDVLQLEQLTDDDLEREMNENGIH